MTTEDDLDIAVGSPDELGLVDVLAAVGGAAGATVADGYLVFPDGTQLGFVDGRPVLQVRWLGVFSPPELGPMRTDPARVAEAVRAATGWPVWTDLDDVPDARRP